jgi:oligoendopeptidase F
MKIEDYRRDFAAYNSALELAHYQHRAGFERELRIEPIYDRYGDLFKREAIDDLTRELAEIPHHKETDSAGLRALIGAARYGYLQAQAKDLTFERALCESSTRIEWKGESLPVYNVPAKIANEPSPAVRRELTARWLDGLSACNDLRAARIESFHESARALGFDSYRQLCTETSQTDFEQLASATEKFLQRTEQAYMSALARATALDLPGAALDDLQHADYFSFERMARLDPLFPADQLLQTYAAAMRGLGIRVEQQDNIKIDDESRPFKNPRAACLRVNPPDDVRLLLSPIGGAYDYRTLFHEAGHAQHLGWSSRELAARHPEFIYAPDYATTEAHAFLFQHLFLDNFWLRERWPHLSAEQTSDAVRTLALRTTCTVRRFCAKLKYEITLHDSQQVRSEHLAATYTALQTEATGFRRDPALYLTDVDDEFYVAAYLRAWAFEAGLREHLRTRYGRRWWASRRAGDELIDLWNTSSRYSVEELARLIGLGEISFELLADTLIAAMMEE